MVNLSLGLGWGKANVEICVGVNLRLRLGWPGVNLQVAIELRFS